MNRENITKVRDVIAGLPSAEFDMRDWGNHECDTAACIGGWTARVVLNDRSLTERVCGDALGLTVGQRSTLFYPRGIELPDGGYWSPYDATPTQAVRVLDHLLATGEVDWNVALAVGGEAVTTGNSGMNQ